MSTDRINPFGKISKNRWSVEPSDVNCEKDSSAERLINCKLAREKI